MELAHSIGGSLRIDPQISVKYEEARSSPSVFGDAIMAGLISSAGTYVSRRWKNSQARVILLGLDSSGKTTLLYRLKLEEQVTTIPTIGFNVETIPVPSEGVDLNMWDISGGCSRLPHGLMRHYQGPEVISLFIIDKADTERADEVIFELEYALRGFEAKYFAVVFNNFENRKPDEAGAQKLVSRTIKAVEEFKRFGNVPCEVYDDLVHFNAATGAQTDILMKRLARASKTQRPNLRQELAINQAAATANPPKLSREELLKKIQDGSRDPIHQLSSDEFMRQLIAGQLEKWDHQCHLRAGFLCLMESILAEHVVFAASDIFLERLDKMLRTSPRRFRNTLHRTLTVFWLHLIYLSMLSFRERNGSLPQPDRFKEFLEQNPGLMQGRSWDEYYTTDALFSLEAKEAWILPDLKPLPQYLSQMKTSETPENDIQIPKGNAETYQRFAYGVVKALKSTKRRRAAIINETLPIIQSYIIHLRAQSPGALEPYSETQAYFWIQMLHAAIESVPSTISLDITSLNPSSGAVSKRGCKTILPKRKSLPNILASPTKGQLDKTVASRLDEKYSTQGSQSAVDSRPSPEELFLRVQWAVKGAAADESDSVYNGSSDSHAVLIRRMFNRLITTEPRQMGETSVPRALWDEMSFLHEGGRFTCAVFWSRMILGAFGRMDAGFHEQVAQLQVEEKRASAEAQTRLFYQFLAASSELCWEGLWKVYYSDEVWKSKDAGVVYVLPDKRNIPAYIK
ncbi:hypothetical protein BBP40_000266 [Aspergillus hancockii]|nr:hypothetical protein BBP40_000266 [Aspergillus hancockii]